MGGIDYRLPCVFVFIRSTPYSYTHLTYSSVPVRSTRTRTSTSRNIYARYSTRLLERGVDTRIDENRALLEDSRTRKMLYGASTPPLPLPYSSKPPRGDGTCMGRDAKIFPRLRNQAEAGKDCMYSVTRAKGRAAKATNRSSRTGVASNRISICRTPYAYYVSYIPGAGRHRLAKKNWALCTHLAFSASLGGITLT